MPLHSKDDIQSDALDDIYAGSLNTVRLVTVRTRDKKLHLLCPYIKFGRGGSYVDNLKAGGLMAPIGISDRRQFTDVPTRLRDRRVAGTRSFFERRVGIGVRVRFRLVKDIDQPGDVTQQIDVTSVSNAKAGAHAVAVKLPLADDFAQWRRVQQPAQFARSEFARVNRHVRVPSPATPRTSRD